MNAGAGASEVLVPKVFHRIWLGGPEPEQFQAWGRTWLQHHPGWELKTWTEETLPPSRYPRLLRRCCSLAQRANIIRYELLMAFGGVYVDADLECTKNIESLIGGAQAFAALQEDDPGDIYAVNNALMGAVPGHPLLRELVADAPLAQPQIPYSLGAPFLTEHVRRYPGVRLFPRPLFFPFRWDELHRRGEAFPEAYAIHHWSSKWFKWAPELPDADPLEPAPSTPQAHEPEPGPERAEYAARMAEAVPGWMGVTELRWLAEQARRRQKIVEFGSFHGRSAKAMALATSGTLWAVDVWNWVSMMPPRIPIWESFQRFHAGEIRSGKVVPLRMSTQSAAAWLKRHQVRADMVFIDGDHAREAVRVDILLAIMLLGGRGSGGLICGHDYNEADFPGVVQAVNELIPTFQLPTEGAGWIWAAVI